MLTSIALILNLLPSFLAALPRILDLMIRLMNAAERFAVWAKERDLDAWLSEVEKTIDSLERSQTKDEKLASARSLSQLFRKL